MRLVTAVIVLFLMLRLADSYAGDTLRSTPDTTFHRYVSAQLFDSFDSVPYAAIDTSLHGFQLYEPVIQSSLLGNTGKAYKKLVFFPETVVGFNLGEYSYSAYLTKPDHVKFYNVSSPYSDLYYVMGGSKEQILKVVHAQNVNDNLNFGFNFNIINSNGTYRRQKTDIADINATGNYRSKNKRYRIAGGVIYGRWYNYENGGLADMQLFTSQLLDRTDQFDINLNNAQNRFKEAHAFVKQHLYFNMAHSSDSSSKPIFNTRLTHSSSYGRSTISYIDEFPSALNYPVYYFDSAYTGDSSVFKLLQNDIMLTHVIARRKDKKPMLSAGAGFGHEYIDYRQFITLLGDSLMPEQKQRFYTGQFKANGTLGFNPTNAISAQLEAFKIFEGYNDGDAGVSAQVNLTFSPEHKLLAEVSASQNTPGLHAARYISNHLIRYYNLKKQETISLKLQHKFKGFQTGIAAYHINHFVYYDTLARTRQHNEALQVVRLSLGKQFRFNHFYINNTIILQQSSSNVLPLPLLINFHSFYWETPMFKKALTAQFGIDFNYFSSFYGPAYQPLTRQFYLQNTTKTGNYPFADVFVNLKIKRALIFAKFAHLNQGFTGFNYYSVQDYPLQGRAIKVGISWKFYD